MSMTLRKRVSTAGLVACVMLAVVATSGSKGEIAMASSTAGNRALTQPEMAQLKLEPAKDAVMSYVEAHPLVQAKVQEIGIDVDHMSIVVYLSGPAIGKATSNAFAKITEATKTPVIVVPVLFSRDDIEKAGSDIIKSQPGVVSVGHDRDTLVVRTKSDDRSRRLNSINVGDREMPIRYEETDIAELATRQNDSNPWTAGARVKVGSTGCSSGFGIFNGESGYFMLTAGHCYNNGATVTDGAGNTMGVTSGRNLSIDTILIDVSTASGYMYDGTWNTTSGSREKVVGTHKVALNEQVCTSGSFTGTHCGIVVKDTTSQWVVGSTTVKGIFATPNSSTAVAAGSGDSGGPVLTNTSTARQIRAAGIISVGGAKVACTGQGTSTCYNDVYFVPIQNAQRGLIVVTG